MNSLRCNTLNPSSSYSLREIHILRKVSSEPSMEPPIQVEYNRSAGALIRTLISLGPARLTSVY